MMFFRINSAVYKPGVFLSMGLGVASGYFVLCECDGSVGEGGDHFFQGLGFGIMFLRNDLGCFFSLWVIGGLGF